MNASRNRGDLPTRLAAVTASLVVAACAEAPGAGGERTASSSAPLAQAQVVPTGQACTPTGKHVEHRAFACVTCHQCEGVVSFDPVRAGATAAFDATAKTCSSVACHAVPAGTYTYYVSEWDWSIDEGYVIPITVAYGGEGGAAAADWYAPAGTSCNACHGYPPTYNGARYTWHSGEHGINMSDGNACQLCHPDATGAYVYGGNPSYVGTSAGLVTSCAPGTYCAAPGTITNRSLHGNGVVEVQRNFRSTCFGCH